MIGLRERATEIIVAEGFVVNRQKTFLASRAGRQTVTGVVVNDIAGLSRQDRRRLRAEAHQQARAEREGKPVSTEARARFEGRLAYLSMLNPGQAQALRAFRDRIA
jgi:hypothetical protein